MKADEVLKLIDAGFTRDEIIAMDTPGEAAPAPEKEEDPEETPSSAPANDPTKEFTTALNGILDSFKTVVDDIKKANIANSEMPAGKSESAEELLASIIAPPAKPKK